MIAEERSFVSGIPVPALVLFRFLRHWAEINYNQGQKLRPIASPSTRGEGRGEGGGSGISASQQPSFLVSYTINSLKALLQSARMDNSLLSFCLANFAVLLHLCFKDKVYYEEDDEDYQDDEDDEEDEDSIEEGVSREGEGGSVAVVSPRQSKKKKKPSRTLILPRYDNLESISTYLLERGIPPVADQEREKEKEGEREKRKEKEYEKESEGEGKKEAVMQKQFSSSVLWFEEHIQILLGTTYSQLLFNICCNADFKRTLENAIFSSRGSRKNTTPRNLNNTNSSNSLLNTSTTNLASLLQEESNEHLDKILSILSDYLSELQSNFVYFGLINQFFQQIFRFIDSVLFNMLLLRKVTITIPFE